MDLPAGVHPAPRFSTIPARHHKIPTHRKILFGFIAAALLLLALEGAARIIIPILGDGGSETPGWYVYSSDTGWKLRPNGIDTWPGTPTRYYDHFGFLVEDTAKLFRPARRPRVVGVGDSTMYGIYVGGKETYFERLNARFPDIDFINLGVKGYSSCNGYYRLIHDALPLKPDLLIASFSFNDRRYVLRPQDVDSPEYFKSITRRAMFAGLRQRIYLLRGIYCLLSHAHLAPGYDEGDRLDIHKDYDQATNVDLGTLKARVEPERYRENLTRIVAVARERHIPIVFMMTGDHPGWMKPIRDGLAREAAGDLPGAIDLFKRAVEADNAFSQQARIELARAYESAGDKEKARQARIDAHPFNSLIGGNSIYRDDQYQAILKEVAARESVPLVDARLIDRPDLYVDFCHFNAEGHQIVAGLLEKTLRENKLIPVANAK